MRQAKCKRRGAEAQRFRQRDSCGDLDFLGSKRRDIARGPQPKRSQFRSTDELIRPKYGSRSRKRKRRAFLSQCFGRSWHTLSRARAAAWRSVIQRSIRRTGARSKPVFSFRHRSEIIDAEQLTSVRPRNLNKEFHAATCGSCSVSTGYNTLRPSALPRLCACIPSREVSQR